MLISLRGDMKILLTLFWLALCEKCLNTAFFLVRIFLHSDWIRKFTGLSKSPYLVRIQENTDQKKLRVWTLSTQCCRIINAITTSGFSRKIIDLLYAALMPAGIYLLKVNNRNIRARCEICSELTIKIPGRRQRRRFGIFIVNFELILHLVLVFLLLTLNM